MSHEIERRRGIGWKITWWLCLVFGASFALEGLVLLLGPEDDYVGFGGNLSWQIGEISSAWTYGFLIVGLGLLGVWLTMLVTGRKMGPVEITPVGDFLFHASVFIVVNAYLWAQDFAFGSALDYAYLTTIFWGIGLAAHGWQALRHHRKTPEPIDHAGPPAPRDRDPSRPTAGV